MSLPPAVNPQPFRRHLAAAVLVVVVVGVPLWALFRYHPWFAGSPGIAQLGGLHAPSLFGARLSLPAQDSDGDGLVDWYETAMGLDPKDSSRRTTVYAMGDRWLVYQGERTRLRLRMHFHQHRDVRWPQGFRAIVSAPTAILLKAEGNAAPTAGPFEVLTTATGDLEFDVLLEVGDWDPGISVKNPVIGEELSPLSPALVYGAGRRLPTVPSRLEMRVPTRLYNSDRTRFTPDFEVPVLPGAVPPQPPRSHLVWEPVLAAQHYVVEISRADRPDDWRTYTILDANTSSYAVVPLIERLLFPQYAGELIYRVVPTTFATRPSGQS